jgi:hypothetical protein
LHYLVVVVVEEEVVDADRHFLRYIFLPLLSPLNIHFRFALSGGGGGHTR